MTAPLHHGKALQNAYFLPDGIQIATILSDHTVRIWNSTTGVAITPPILPFKKIRSSQLNLEGSLLIVSGGTGATNSAQIFDVISGKATGLPLNHNGVVNYAEFSPNGQLIATASDDGTVRVWNALTQEPITSGLVHSGAARYTLFSPDHSLVATLVNNDHNVRLWNIQTGELITAHLHHNEKVRALQFSPDSAPARHRFV